MAVASMVIGACNDTPTTAVVDNAFPIAAAPVTIYRTWWITTLFPDAVAPGASSTIERTVPGSDYAYALLAPGWLAGASSTPPALVAVKSAVPLAVAAHDVLHIVVDDTTFTGDCAAGSTLTADDADLITERIFPGAFAGATYDPATCTTTPVQGVGGAGGEAGAGGDGGQGGSGGAGAAGASGDSTTPDHPITGGTALREHAR